MNEYAIRDSWAYWGENPFFAFRRSSWPSVRCDPWWIKKGVVATSWRVPRAWDALEFA